MAVKDTLRKLIETKVFENYSMMTLANILGVLIGFAIYPYVIRVIGADSYGECVFATAVVGLAQMFVSYGFNIPCAKMVVEQKDNPDALETLVSCVFTAKIFLLVASSALMLSAAYVLDGLLGDIRLLAWGLLTIVGDVLFPTWYFQGMKRMKVVTLINVGVRLLSIPIVFLMVSSPDDTVTYMAITAATTAAGGVFSVIWMARRERIRLRYCQWEEVKPVLKAATPFFIADLATNIKEYSMDVLVGKVFGMADLALYDLAHKIVRTPRMFTQNINGALFPEVVDKATPERVRKMLRYELLIGLGMMGLVALFGWPAVMILGGEQMIDAYPLAIFLSTTIPTWLIVGAYLDFVFVANGRYTLVTVEQVFALIAGLTSFGLCILLWNDIAAAPVSMAFATLCEIAFCAYLSKKHKLL